MNTNNTNISLDQLKKKLFDNVTTVLAEDIETLLYFVYNTNRGQPIELKEQPTKLQTNEFNENEFNDNEFNDQNIKMLSSIKRTKTLEKKYNKPGIKSAMQVPNVARKSSNTKKITKITNSILKGNKIPVSMKSDTINHFKQETDPSEIDRCIKLLKHFNDDYEVLDIYGLIASLETLYNNTLHASKYSMNWQLQSNKFLQENQDTLNL